jgi:transcriptional regulator with XRE-family HTH domain
MREILAGNIARYRKDLGLTQEELARRLGITFQAVSKWETGQTVPDTVLLPSLARELNVSVDKLMGYDVSAFDISEAGLDKTKRLAEKARVPLRVFRADIWDYRLEERYDILYSSGTLHYIKPELRDEIMRNYKARVNENGLAAFHVFVKNRLSTPRRRKRKILFYGSPGSCSHTSTTGISSSAPSTSLTATRPASRTDTRRTGSLPGGYNTVKMTVAGLGIAEEDGLAVFPVNNVCSIWKSSLLHFGDSYCIIKRLKKLCVRQKRAGGGFSMK